jgi:hypothetical protein
MIFVLEECNRASLGLWRRGVFIGGWLDDWHFNVKLSDTGTGGICGGSIEKMWVYRKDITCLRGYRLVIAYDRGWIKRKRPKEPRAVAALRELRAYFDGGLNDN